MNDCAGGVSTDRFDMLTPLEAWVERGVAPDSVVAEASNPGYFGVASRTRPRREQLHLPIGASTAAGRKQKKTMRSTARQPMRKVLLLGACLAVAGSSVISQEVLRIGAINRYSGSLAL